MENENMKKCENCGTFVPRDAVYCDVCGEVVSKRRARKQEKAEAPKGKFGRPKTFKEFMMLAGMSFVMMIAILIVIGIISGAADEARYREYERKRDLSGWEETVTPEEFEKIEIGMTYEEVKEVIGGDGKMIEKEKYWHTYRWPGDYYVDKNFGYLELRFDTNTYGVNEGKPPMLEEIDEREIVHGADCHDTYIKLQDGKYSELDTEYVTRAQLEKIEAGMSYEQVCEAIGAEGKHYRSSTWIRENRTDRRDEYVWKTKRGDWDNDFSQSFEDGVVKEIPSWELDFID